MSTMSTRERMDTIPYDRFRTEYLAEIREGTKAMQLPEFKTILERMTDYPAYAESRTCIRDPLTPITKESKDSCVIDLTKPGPESRLAIYTAQMAAVCVLVEGANLPRADFVPEQFTQLVTQHLDSLRGQALEVMRAQNTKLHTMDTMRTQQLLRAFGLFTPDPDRTYQLGLGAGNCLRDAFFVHAEPWIRNSLQGGRKFVSLGVERRWSKHLVLTDSDPEYRNHYIKLNNREFPDIDAFNEETDNVLTRFSDTGFQNRNLVTAIRFDHRMFPDVPGFLSLLSPCLSDECDFIASVGAGDTIEDFIGRMEKITEFFKVLKSSGLQPVVFKFHGPGKPLEKWQAIAFGGPSATTYEMLYCKLKKNNLMDSFCSAQGGECQTPGNL